MKRSSRFLLSLLVSALSAGDASAATEKLVHTFVPYSHGAVPSTHLVADAAGNFYGTTNGGGAQQLGTVLELMPNGSGGWKERVLYNFKGGSDGQYPLSGVTFDAAGNLYGTTNLGGASGVGTVFELKPTARGTWSESVIYSFAGGEDGARPQDGLVADAAGNFYGSTPMGGYLDGGTVTGSGTVFELTLSSGRWILTTLHTFGSNLDGAMPSGRLIIDSGGNLYGTTELGGTSGTQGNYGTVFELSPAPGGWNESVIYNFTGGTDGGGSAAELTVDKAGNLYGTAVTGGQKNSACLSGCGLVFELSPNGNGSWTQRVLYSFTAGKDGSFPHGGLIFDAAGNLYGTTSDGGGGCTASFGCGTVFELAPTSGSQWEEKVLTSFVTLLSVDATLIFDPSGNLYGTTYAGGSANMGTLFKLTPGPSGQWGRSFPFLFRGYDGAQPNALLLDSAGNLYGTSSDGGVFGHGAVFKLTPNSNGGWANTLLYSFKGGTDGASPNSLTFDNAGNLYGTASQGGNATCGGNGCGVVFKLVPKSQGGWTENVLHTFSGLDGNEPMGGVIFDPGGNLYGTTYYGGNQCQVQSPGWPGCGTVFKLTPATGGGWTETVLHNFSGDPDGAWPNAGVVIDAAGNLYGATASGSIGGGVVFKLAPAATGLWTESILHSFNGYPVDGSGPNTGVILDSAGNIYGTTYSGGSGNCSGGYGCGTVFELTPSSGNPWTESILVNFSPSGSVGDGPMGLSFDRAGDLYGLTSSGGSNACSGGGCGAIYKLSPGTGGQWTETVLHTFTGPPKDGSLGVTLISDAAGNVYAAGGGGTATQGVIVEVMP